MPIPRARREYTFQQNLNYYKQHLDEFCETFEGYSKSEISWAMGGRNRGHERDRIEEFLKKNNVVITKKRNHRRYSDAQIFCRNTLASQNTIRQRLFNLTNNKCVICDSNEDLEMHHKNGDPYDNRIENLEILCHNCHCEKEGKPVNLPDCLNLRKHNTEETRTRRQTVFTIINGCRCSNNRKNIDYKVAQRKIGELKINWNPSTNELKMAYKALQRASYSAKDTNTKIVNDKTQRVDITRLYDALDGTFYGIEVVENGKISYKIPKE